MLPRRSPATPARRFHTPGPSSIPECPPRAHSPTRRSPDPRKPTASAGIPAASAHVTHATDSAPSPVHRHNVAQPYCLLGNHVHFLLVPQSDKALARLFLRVHTWWAMYFNAKTHRSGHLFQGRFHSCVLSKSHYWAALRYIETNPRKHNLSNDLAAWEYSSATQHLTGRPDEFIKLMMGAWHRRFTTQTYPGFLEESAYELAVRLEKSLTNGLPCGPDRWVRVLEKKAKRRLHPLPPGRPPRPTGQPKVFAA